MSPSIREAWTSRSLERRRVSHFGNAPGLRALSRSVSTRSLSAASWRSAWRSWTSSMIAAKRLAASCACSSSNPAFLAAVLAASTTASRPSTSTPSKRAPIVASSLRAVSARVAAAAARSFAARVTFTVAVRNASIRARSVAVSPGAIVAGTASCKSRLQHVFMSMERCSFRSPTTSLMGALTSAAFRRVSASRSSRARESSFRSRSRSGRSSREHLLAVPGAHRPFADRGRVHLPQPGWLRR